MTDWTSRDYVVVDVEGNGQQPPDLVELAAVPIAAGLIGEPRSWLVRPTEPIAPFARRIHGITNEQVAGRPVFTEIRDEVLAAHRATYDALVTARLFVRLATLPDTRPLSLEELRGGGDDDRQALF
jgi:DNA polymerase III epsilon subunit-like protein